MPRGGDKAAADALLPMVEEELRHAAALRTADKGAGHTLSATYEPGGVCGEALLAGKGRLAVLVIA